MPCVLDLPNILASSDGAEERWYGPPVPLKVFHHHNDHQHDIDHNHQHIQEHSHKVSFTYRCRWFSFLMSLICSTMPSMFTLRSMSTAMTMLTHMNTNTIMMWPAHINTNMTIRPPMNTSTNTF